MAAVQISAIISEETRTLLDRAAESRGLKKGHVIEEALLHYLHALRELPSDILLPSLSEASAEQVLLGLTEPAPATPEMLALMAGLDGEDVPT